MPVPDNFNDADPKDVLKNIKRAEILKKLDVKFDPSIAPLPSWDDTKDIKYARSGITDETENLPDYRGMSALGFAYYNVAAKSRPGKKQYYIFRMMTGTGKSTIIPIAWMLSGAKGPLLMTQPRRENVLSITRTLSTYAGDWFELPRNYVEQSIKIVLDDEKFPKYKTEDNFSVVEKVTIEMFKKLKMQDIADQIENYTLTGSITLNRSQDIDMIRVLTSMNTIIPHEFFTELIDLRKVNFEVVDFRLGASDVDPLPHKDAPNPKILVVSEGWLLEKLIREPTFINKYHSIIFDEAHERTAEFDLLFSYLNMQKIGINVILASATITESQFMQFSPHRIFLGAPSKEIEIIQNFVPTAPYIPMLTDALIKILDTRTESIIAFLPIVSNVEIMMKKFSEKYKNVLFFDFTARSTPESRDNAKNVVGRRKVIFATNAAETGITFSEVDICVDTGMQNLVSYDPIYDSSSAKIDLIYYENAKQRMGRVGRIRKGYYYPLFDLNSLKKSPPPKILDQNSYSSIYRMMMLGKNSDFRQFNKNLLTPISEIAIYHGLSNLYHMHIIKQLGDSATEKNKKLGYMLGSMFRKSIMGNIRYLVAAGLSRRTEPLFAILYAASKFGVTSAKIAYTYLPFSSDHLQIIMHFYDYMFFKSLDGKITSESITFDKIADEVVRILDLENYTYDKNSQPSVYVMEKKKGLYPLRLVLENCLNEQLSENFETFRRCMFLSHEDKIATLISGNNYKWRGLNVKIAEKHYLSEIRIPPAFMVGIKGFKHRFITGPPRLAFTEISKNSSSNYASISTFTAV